MELRSQDPCGTVNWETVKGTSRRITHTKTHRGSQMKDAQILCERGSFYYLKVWAWGSYWNALQTQRLANTIFVLCLCLAPSGRHDLCTSPVLSSRELVSPGREVLQVSGDKFFCSCHPKDDPCLAWLFWQARLVILDSMGQNLGQIPPLGYCADTRLKHTPSLSVNKTYFLVLELQSEGPASGTVHNQGSNELLSRNGEWPMSF